MGKIIQLVLFSFLIIIAVIFYNTYFTEKITKKEVVEKENETPVKNKNNLIKNLKYEIRLDEDKQYIITSDLSELTYEDQIEIVKMQKVVAIFIDQNNIPLTIVSDYAKYNNYYS